MKIYFYSNYEGIWSFMRKACFVNFLFFTLIILPGCSVKLVTMGSEDKRLNFLPRRDINEMSLTVTKSDKDPNRVEIWHINNSKIQLSKPCRIRYESFYFDFIDLIAVPGTLPNGKKYTILLDTGHQAYAIINSFTMQENNLPFCPLDEIKEIKSYIGFCELSSIQLGQAVIKNPPCAYFQQQWEVRLVGLPIWQQRGVLLGLGLLKEFSYILFDNVKKEVELSLSETFEPAGREKWDSYKFEIKKNYLIVNLPVEGQNFEMMFDSCGRYGMVLNSNFWETLSPKLNYGKIKDNEFQSGFRGELPCRRTKIKRLHIGNTIAKDAEVLILPEDSPYMDVAHSVSISMKYFKKTVVVLDFKNRLMWIKK